MLSVQLSLRLKTRERAANNYTNYYAVAQYISLSVNTDTYCRSWAYSNHNRVIAYIQANIINRNNIYSTLEAINNEPIQFRIMT